LLSIITQCNAHKRYKLQVDDEILPTADIEHDLAEVLYITHNLSGIPTFKTKVFKDVIIAAYNTKDGPDSDPNDSNKKERIKALTTRECCDKFKETYKKSISTDNFKKVYLNEFLNNGLIDEEESLLHKSRRIHYPIVDLSLYNGHDKQEEQKTDNDTSFTSNLSRFDVYLQQRTLLSPKNHIKIAKSWLELEILFIIQHRIGEDNNAKPIPEVLNGEFSLMNECNERVCICQCIDFLNTPSLIRCYFNASFVEDSQETKKDIEYLYKIYPCYPR
jgi:hypothetical protein